MDKYAPEYSRKEMLVSLLKRILWALPIVIALQYYFLPWFENYGPVSHCHQMWGITGFHFIIYSFCVFAPLLSSIVLFLCEGIKSLKIIKLGQSPLPNEKVYKKTKYKYGVRAKIKPVVMLSSIVFFAIMSIPGYFIAEDFLSDVSGIDYSLCDISQSS